MCNCQKFEKSVNKYSEVSVKNIKHPAINSSFNLLPFQSDSKKSREIWSDRLAHRASASRDELAHRANLVCQVSDAITKHVNVYASKAIRYMLKCF